MQPDWQNMYIVHMWALVSVINWYRGAFVYSQRDKKQTRSFPMYAWELKKIDSKMYEKMICLMFSIGMMSFLNQI